ncbi:MAG: carbohydrate porin [Verrucomicrobiota bacterium]
MPLLVKIACPLFAAGSLAVIAEATDPPTETSTSSELSHRAISGNTAAVNTVAGTGQLGELVGMTPDTGLRLGGVFLSDFNWLITGGKEPGKTGWNFLFILDGQVDLEKTIGIPGAGLGSQFLLYKGHDINGQAGTILGYNSLEALPPLNRAELYQLWWRQTFLNDSVIVRLGKSVPTVDFTNVLTPIPINNEPFKVPALSGLIYTPAFINPSMLGAIPGYYDSAWGVTLNIVPHDQFYINWGIYDGSLASGFTTGNHAFPRFNGTYFMIAETGGAWSLSEEGYFGRAGFGGWQQTGDLTNGTITEDGTYGFYGFASQAIWQDLSHKNDTPGKGIIAFFQWGINESETLPFNGYLGAGATAFGLVPNRAHDTFGFGAAYGWLNPNNFQRDHELMLQTYYQAQVTDYLYVQPVISYIRNPGASPSFSDAWALSMRATLLF